MAQSHKLPAYNYNLQKVNLVHQLRILKHASVAVNYGYTQEYALMYPFLYLVGF